MKKCPVLNALFAFLLAMSLILSACAPKAIAAVTPFSTAPNPTVAPTTLPIISPQPPTVAPTPFPQLTFQKGDNYFRVDGKQNFIFSRNITAAYNTNFSDVDQFLTYAQAAGDRLVRLQIDNLGLGFTKNGEVDEAWAQKWEKIFDLAAAKGLYVIPEFGVWLWWNQDGQWSKNPFNTVNGGPANTPAELFKKDSPTQKNWLAFVQKLVQRWQSRQNIIAWEIFSEINLVSGSSSLNALAFVEPAAAVIREADPLHRPVTVSVADVVSVWSGVNASDKIDFLEVHSYPENGRLDRDIVQSVGQRIRDFHKPVLIGESGMSGLTPNPFLHLPTAARSIGINHAIWASVVSGAMNGRALWDEDSYAIYWDGYSDADKSKFILEYSKAEIPAANFVKGVDFSGFLPLAVQLTDNTKIWGAAVGNETMVLGWFRDAGSEPPAWNLQPVITKQTVTLTVPGTAANWKVDFYDTKTGTDIIDSEVVTRSGKTVTISLPDFKDDLAFKMSVQN
jgi:hypothetical protein